MRGTSAEGNTWEKEDYESLAATHGNRVCSYRLDNRRFAELLFKEAVQTCGQQISYYGVVYHHKNAIVERRIKELTRGSRNLLLNATRLCTEVVSTMLWPSSFKTA